MPRTVCTDVKAKEDVKQRVLLDDESEIVDDELLQKPDDSEFKEIAFEEVRYQYLGYLTEMGSRHPSLLLHDNYLKAELKTGKYEVEFRHNFEWPPGNGTPTQTWIVKDIKFVKKMKHEVEQERKEKEQCYYNNSNNNYNNKEFDNSKKRKSR